MAGDDEGFADWITELHDATTNRPDLFGYPMGDTTFLFTRTREAAVRRIKRDPGNGFHRVKIRLQLWYEDCNVEEVLADRQSRAAGTDLDDYKPPELQPDAWLEAVFTGYGLEFTEEPAVEVRRTKLVEAIIDHEGDILAGLVSEAAEEELK